MPVPARVRRVASQILPGSGRKPLKVRPLEAAPASTPFPQVGYFYVVNAVPRNFAGRSSSIFTKARVLFEQGGVTSTLVTFLHSSELADIEHGLRERGVIGDYLRLVCLHDFYPDSTQYQGPDITHELDIEGMTRLADGDQPVYRYFDAAGVYCRYRRYDYAGRLIVQDFFNPNRGRTLREEYRANGTLRRRIYMDLACNLPRQEIHYRADQTPAFTVWWVVDASGEESVVEKVITFDEAGVPIGMSDRMDEINHRCLDELIGQQPALVMVEDRHVDSYLLSYHRRQVRSIYVLHNAHIKEPFDDVRAIRPSFRPILEARKKVDAIVFLTATQRAEAEAVFGRAASFTVLPHSTRPVSLDPAIERDPSLVVMMARLDKKQKQVNHAIEAFARVVKHHPKARLEIYGRGPDQAVLSRLITSLGLGEQVKLMGFTDQPGVAYQRASLCIMTSKFEGAPLTVLEAMSYGCPVASYDLRYGPADVITDGVDGLLVPYGNERAMAKTVIRVLNDPALLQRLSAAARRRAADFNELSFGARWAALFSRLDPSGTD